MFDKSESLCDVAERVKQRGVDEENVAAAMFKLLPNKHLAGTGAVAPNSFESAAFVAGRLCETDEEMKKLIRALLRPRNDDEWREIGETGRLNSAGEKAGSVAAWRDERAQEAAFCIFAGREQHKKDTERRINVVSEYSLPRGASTRSFPDGSSGRRMEDKKAFARFFLEGELYEHEERFREWMGRNEPKSGRGRTSIFRNPREHGVTLAPTGSEYKILAPTGSEYKMSPEDLVWEYVVKPAWGGVYCREREIRAVHELGAAIDNKDMDFLTAVAESLPRECIVHLTAGYMGESLVSTGEYKNIVVEIGRSVSDEVLERAADRIMKRNTRSRGERVQDNKDVGKETSRFVASAKEKTSKSLAHLEEDSFLVYRQGVKNTRREDAMFGVAVAAAREKGAEHLEHLIAGHLCEPYSREKNYSDLVKRAAREIAPAVEAELAGGASKYEKRGEGILAPTGSEYKKKQEREPKSTVRWCR